MKRIIVGLALVMNQGAPVFAAAQNVDVTVNGMVCSFCAQGIKKKFTAEDAVDKINVSLEKHQVSLAMKDGKSLTDDRITSLLKDSGYSVEKIERK